MKTKLSVLILLLFAVCTTIEAEIEAEAEYEITFQGGWTLEPLPGGAHFSPLVGATHAAVDEIFAVGGLASPGVEQVAELGTTGVIINEINSKIQNGVAGSLIFRSGNIDNEATVSTTVTTNVDHSRLSLLSMIAPSPDWFVGVNSLDLRENDQWRDKIVLVLNSYDAGTEEGENFSLNNPATNPQQAISALDVAEPNNPLAGFGSVATITITRINAPKYALGDVNRDGSVNLLDVMPFVNMPASSFLPEADINCDGSFDLLDVQPFVELLIANANSNDG